MFNHYFLLVMPMIEPIFKSENIYGYSLGKIIVMGILKKKSFPAIPIHLLIRIRKLSDHQLKSKAPFKRKACGLRSKSHMTNKKRSALSKKTAKI